MKLVLAFLGLWLVVATPLRADVLSITVTRATLATVNDATEVDYNVVAFAVPEVPEGRVLTEAILEFNLNVSSTLGDSLSGGAVTVEVIVTPELVEGRLSVSHDELITRRVVKVGDNQRVRVYITEILRQAMAENEPNLSLLVGSITGGRRGRFDANAVPGASGAKAVLTIQTQEAYVDAARSGR